MKRFWEEDVLFPYHVPEEIIVVFLEVAFPRYETNERDYFLLNRMRFISKTFGKMVDTRMSEAKRVPSLFERILGNDQIRLLHPNIKQLTDCTKELKLCHECQPQHNIHIVGIPYRDPASMTKALQCRDSHCRNFISLADRSKLTFNYCGDLMDEQFGQLPNLTSLMLNSNSPLLTPVAFLPLYNLKELFISNNHSVTDDYITHLTQLETLQVNKVITDVALKALTNLRSLIINSKSKKISFLCESLTSLDLSRNNSMIDDTCLRKLTNLKSLSLQNHQHTPYNSLITKESISTLTTLTTLELCGNKAVRDDWIFTLTNLTELDICQTNITGNVFSQLPLIKKLILPKRLTHITLEQLYSLKYLRDLKGSNYFGELHHKDLPPYIYLEYF